MLIIVPTPLGNLEDITIRSLNALKDCDLIVCEDTRRTLKLLLKYAINKNPVRYNEHSERSVSETLESLKRGRRVALVTDGGTPCISDPGRKLVALARLNNIKVEVLPGPSAVCAAASGSGMPVDSFVFLGFLPRSSGKILKILKKAFELEKTLILYESPFRIKKLLELVAREIGPGTETVVARELTKIFEEWISGSAEQVLKELSSRKEIKGEIVVLLRAPRSRPEPPDPDLP